MSRLRRAALCVALVASLVALPGIAHAVKTIALSSGSFQFDVEPGGAGEGEVTVINDGDEPLKALVYVADVRVDSAGEQTFVPPQRQGTALMSTPASWFRLSMPSDSKSVGNTPYIELDPDERVAIRFEFTPPAGTAPGDHNVVIFFEMFELAEGAAGSSAQVTGRLGTRVALRVNGQVVEKLSLRPFVVPSYTTKSVVPYRFTVSNEGNINERVAISAAVFDGSENSAGASVVTTDTVVLARTGQQFIGDIPLSAQRFGRHTVEVRLSYVRDGDQLPTEIVEQRRSTAPKSTERPGSGVVMVILM